MILLSRSEELVLLAIWNLKGNAYGIPIRELLSKWTGHDWAIGAIYKPLKQLYHKRLVEQFLCEPVAERGGRGKQIYKITQLGEEALNEIKKIHELAWNEKSKTIFSK